MRQIDGLQSGGSSEGVIPRRPTLFRALGRGEPPATIDIDGRRYQREVVLKHDSWAATAVFSDSSGHRIACKFNRAHRLFFLPMGWLGRHLAQREWKALQRLNGTDGFPTPVGPISADGVFLPNAVAHEWIEGETFKPWLPVDEHFFPRLRAMIATLHTHDMAYVDMAKWENILVGNDGRPYLLDYQIHFHLPRHWPGRWWLRCLQAADLYYLHRQWLRARPDQVSPADRDAWMREPGLVQLGETLGGPWRWLRLRILAIFGVKVDVRRQRVDSAEPSPLRS
jgi:hypothetical protein